MEDLLELWLDVGHRLLAVLAARVDGDVLHRAWAVERVERDQILEHGRLDGAERLAHARRLELEDAGRFPAGQHGVDLLVVERDGRDVETVADEGDRLVDDVEVAQAEEVHLQEAHRLDVGAGELGDELLVGALLLQRDDVDERLRADDDGGGVDPVLAREALERAREVHDLLRDRVAVDRLPQFRAGLEAFVERLPRAFGDELRDLVDDAVRDFEHAAGVADGSARGHRPEGDDLRDAVRAVLLAHVVDDALASLHCEVDVGVGKLLAARVEEALEQEVVADRVDVGDLEAVGDERAGGGAAARADADPVPLRERDEVPDDEEVVGEAHLADGLQLELEALAQVGVDLVVALPEAPLAQLDEVVERVAVVGDRVVRQEDAAELDLDVAALGDLERAAERVVVAGEVERHLLRRLEVEVVGVELPVVRVLQRVARLDAEQRLVCARIVVHEVVDVARGDGRKLARGGEGGELGEDALLHVEVRVLELDVDVAVAEDLHEAVELLLRVGGAALLQRFADAAGEAAGEGDEAVGVALEQLPVDARLVVVALEVAERGELDEVLIAGGRLREEGEVRVALRLRAAVVGDVDLAADDRFDPVLLGGLDEVDGAGE